MKTKYLVALFILFFSISAVINHGYLKKKIFISEALYIFPAENTKHITAGFDNLFSDFYYIWAIQFYSEPPIARKINYISKIFSVIGTLDPHFKEPYIIGALIAFIEGGDIEKTIEILDMGMKNQPYEYWFPMEAGFYLKRKRKFKKAALYFDIAAHKEDSPEFLKRVWSEMYFHAGDLKRSFNLWKRIYEKAKTNYEKYVSYKHLYEIKRVMDKKRFEKIVKLFKNKHGRLPYSFRELIEKGFIKTIPRDFDGQPYIYDRKKGTLKSRKRFRWRD